MLYNFFENSLKSLCKVLNEEFKTPIEFSELNGDDLVKCKKYLTKICGLNAKIFDTSNWKKIDCIRRLRNCAVHNFSDISSVLKMDGIIVNDFKKADGFVIVDNHFGILKKDFLMIILQLIIDFQNELTIELKRIQKLKMN